MVCGWISWARVSLYMWTGRALCHQRFVVKIQHREKLVPVVAARRLDEIVDFPHHSPAADVRQINETDRVLAYSVLDARIRLICSTLWAVTRAVRLHRVA